MFSLQYIPVYGIISYPQQLYTRFTSFCFYAVGFNWLVPNIHTTKTLAVSLYWMKTTINFSDNFLSRVVWVFLNKRTDSLQNAFPFSLLTYPLRQQNGKTSRTCLLCDSRLRADIEKSSTISEHFLSFILLAQNNFAV